MLNNNSLKKKTLGSSLIESFLELSSEQPNHKILEQIDIYGSAMNDGSVVIYLDWIGDTDPRPVLDFFNKAKAFVISSRREVKEQVPPNTVNFNNLHRITYRFRVWDAEGKYEYMEKILEEN